MKKKLIALCLVICLAAVAAIGGTLAYFTDTEQATNTMVIGNVEINIEEHVKAKNADGEYEYEPFVDDEFTLYPVASDTVFEDLNAHYNKVVRTFNTSPSGNDAYIRTIILIEKNDALTDAFEGEGDCCVPGLHFGYFNGEKSTTVDGKTSHGVTTDLLENTVTVDGEDYWVIVCTAMDEKAIPVGEALHSLNMVWMDKNITSEQIAGWQTKDNDGNITDNKVSILVYSQGIQSYDLTHAEAMEALGTVNQSLIDTLTGATIAAENDYTNN